jgi:hypothetical protein
MDALVASLTSADQDFSLWFPSITNVAGGFVNLARGAVTGFGQAAIPTVAGSGGHIPTDGNPGYPTISAPGGGQSLYIGRIEAAGTVTGTITVYDRVYAASGFVGNVITAQAITGMPTLPAARAPNDGEGLEIWLESYTAIGATASQVTVQYTNSAGTSGRNTVSEAITASFPVNRLQRLRYQDGDTGVQSVQSVTLSVSTGTAGNFGIVLLERKCTLPLTFANVSNVMDFAATGLPTVQADSALMFVSMSTATTTGNIIGTINIVAG